MDKHTCKTCEYWECKGEQELSGGIALNDGAVPRGEVGECHKNPPRMVMVAQQSPLGQVQGTLQRIFPITLAVEFCSAHPLRKRDEFNRQVALALGLYFNRLTYDPDKHQQGAGFNRPPSLAEAREMAANIEKGGEETIRNAPVNLMQSEGPKT